MGNTCSKLLFVTLVLLVSGAALGSTAGTGEFDRLIEYKGPSVLEVLETPTLYRVARLDNLPCDSRTFEYLLDRPRTAIVLARWADPSLDNYTIQVKEDGTYHVDDSGGLAGDMELVEGVDGRRVYYISGHWRFVLGITFEGRMVLVPEYEERAEDAGPVVDATTRGYMKIDNAFIGLMARLVVYVFPGKVDARIDRFAKAVRKVAAAVREDPAGVYVMLSKSGKVPDSEVEEFRRTFLPVSGRRRVI